MEILTESIFYEVTTLLVLTTVLGLLGLVLRQPLIVAFMAVGVLAGPTAFDIARSTDAITLLADLGIALLLFLVGLKLDLHLIRTLGGVALATGLGQVIFTSIVGGLLCLAMGLDPVTSLYVAVALTFSSTIIIVKLLTDKREVDSLHGRIALGFLIVQDLVVVVALGALSTLGLGQEVREDPAQAFGTMILAALALILLGVGMWFIAERLLARLLRTPDLLIIFTITWAVLMAALGDFSGLGQEMGGLAAGVALSASPLRELVAGRLTSVREFLLLFFFIALGSHLDLELITLQIREGLVLSLFVLVGNPLIVLIIMGSMGYRKRTSFLAGLTVAQISEFSLVFIAMGLAVGHVQPEAVGLVTFVGLVTIAASTYMIYYSHRLYALFEPVLGVFERRDSREDIEKLSAIPLKVSDVLIVGLGRYGSSIARRMVDRGLGVLGIDFDPDVIRRLREEGMTAVLGDVSDPDLLEHLPLHEVKCAVCAVPASVRGLTSDDPRHIFLQALRTAGFPGTLVVSASHGEEAERLQAQGAQLVLLPFQDAAKEAADQIATSLETDPAPASFVGAPAERPLS